MTILGLDIGGANLKAATLEPRAVSVPFPLWKHPEKLPAALRELVARFPEADELAVAMTGELCDCYETKREGVNAILDAVESVRKPARVWSTGGRFVSLAEARANHLDVAAANWHALATFAGRYAPHGSALLVDTGSTTTDIIPLMNGQPCATGRTDWQRLLSSELVYRGVGRTAVHAVLNDGVCAELFATTQDAFVVLGLMPEDAANTDTADGRPLTRDKSLARLARMLGGDVETHSVAELVAFAERIRDQLLEDIGRSVRKHPADAAIVSGAGEFLVRLALEKAGFTNFLSLNSVLGPAVSACAPAYALAALAGS
jgi:probable H4MPT-linked C1 transfer pathway protein